MLRVCFNCYGSYTTDSVYQWDLNHTLEITGLTVDDAPTVHFCNKKSELAMVVQSELVDNAITVPIPNQLLQEPYNIIAYVHTYDENHAKTIEIVNIPLLKRAKPDDYLFTENIEIMNFERLEKDFADLEDLVADYKQQIDDALAEIDKDLSTVDGKYPNNSDEGFSYIKPRRGTTNEWETANPILEEGEIGIEVPSTGVGTGLVKIKFGDGVTPWNNLPYGIDDIVDITDYIVQNFESDATDKIPSVATVKSAITTINAELAKKATTDSLSAETTARTNADTALQTQITASQTVSAVAFSQIISSVASYIGGYLLEKDGVVYFSLAFYVSNITNAITTNIASIPYKPYGLCHCPGVLFNGTTSYSIFVAINDGIIQVHFPSDVVLNSDMTQNRLRFSGSFPINYA